MIHDLIFLYAFKKFKEEKPINENEKIPGNE